MTKKAKTEWLEKKLREITHKDDSEKSLCEKDSNIRNEIYPWAPLKLVSLKYIASVYIDIIEKRVPKLFDGMYYVDLFSGSGICMIKGSPLTCCGSPLIIDGLQKQKQKHFTKMFVNDSNEEYARALHSRLQDSQAEVVVTHQDANKCLDEVATELPEKSHSLIFVDPNCSEFSWKSMEKVLGLDSDIFFLFQSGELIRGLSVACNPDAHIFNFFKDGERAQRMCNSAVEGEKASAVFEMYKEDVKEARGPKTLLESIRIDGGRFYYDMLFITKRTRQGSPWHDRAIIPLKDKIERYNSDDVTQTLDRIAEKTSQHTLANW
jgi:hypothetical protein